jgi:hypothetical protein
MLFLPNETALRKLERQDFVRVHDRHWQIESFHRVIKQVCNIERFHVSPESAIRTHLFCALQAFCKLQTVRVEGVIDNLYQVSRQLFIPVIRPFILENFAMPRAAWLHTNPSLSMRNFY